MVFVLTKYKINFPSYTKTFVSSEEYSRLFLKGILSLLIDLKSLSPSPLVMVGKKMNIAFSPNAQQQILKDFATQAPQTIRTSFGTFSQI